MALHKELWWCSTFFNSVTTRYGEIKPDLMGHISFRDPRLDVDNVKDGILCFSLMGEDENTFLLLLLLYKRR